jgi:murein L,D-transpeptidase YafK
MKSLLVTGVLCFGSLASCEERETTPAIAMSERSKLPGIQRAAAAAAAVRPGLERDLKAVGLKYGDPVFLRAIKEEMVVELFVRDRTSGKFKRFRSYPIAGTSGQLGPKLAEGDMQVPEGFYQVPPSAMNPQSLYHLSFNIGYPNAYDRAQQRTGSAIMIHGNQISIGCLAMTDEKIEEIYTLCAAAHAGGQKFFRVHLFPFRMTDARMAVASGHRWEDFWRNLKAGYDAFETHGTPPEIGVENRGYVVRPTSKVPPRDGSN